VLFGLAAYVLLLGQYDLCDHVSYELVFLLSLSFLFCFFFPLFRALFLAAVLSPPSFQKNDVIFFFSESP